MIEDSIPPLRGPRPASAARAFRTRRHAMRHPGRSRRQRAADPGRGGVPTLPQRFPRPRALAALTRTSRRSALRALFSTGAGLGLAMLSVFPPARTAVAAGFRLAPVDLWQIYDRCPSYASDHNCSPGCGPSVVCRDCCQPGGAHKGYHHTLKSSNGRYRLRPNQCFGNYDGWLWRYTGRCGGCQRGVLWRCHDGWRRSTSGHWYKTICRWPVECNR
jgi:hypothetical protein